FDVCDAETAKLVLLSLAETLGARLRKDGVKVGVVAVGIRDYLFEYHSHQISLETSTSITRELYEAACRAFDEAWDKTPIRHLGIHTSRVSSEKSRQLGLFDRMDYEKLERMDKAVDEIRRRFGNDAVKRAAFLPEHPGKTAVHDHMGGGIAREKRTVDYSRQEVL
ncbi:MAG: DNA polymerase IV, partial [Hungatella hathewayi]|nr:DNA polymerase IV [Hungatella hathewayi]